MKQLKLRNSGLQIPSLSLGTWSFGGDAIWGETDEKQAVRTVHCAVELGMVQIDTAPAYGMGRSEEILGKALIGIRDKVTLSTKCGLNWEVGAEGSLHVERDGHRIVRNLSAVAIRRDLENSLRRLHTDYIDIYYTHWPVPEPYNVPVQETLEELGRMKKEGKIRAIGASNMTAELLEEYLQYGDVEILQEKYSLLDRRPEEKLLGICREKEIVLQAYSPLEQGLLTEKFRNNKEPLHERRFAGKIWEKKENRVRLRSMLDGWQDLYEKYRCGLEQLAIAWLLEQGKINVLCGARKPDHLESNIRGADLELMSGDIDRIRRDLEDLQVIPILS